MSGDDQVNATTLLQGSRVLFLTQDSNQSVGLNSYVDVPTNAVMGLVIFDELNDPPNQTRVSINNDGITKTFNNGDPTLNVSWSNFYLLKDATQALRLPITANILVANDTIEANDNNLAKTRISSISALPSVNPQLTLKADTGGAVWEEADLTQNGLTYTDNTGTSTSANWASIIAGSATPTLYNVLNTGNNASGLSIAGVNDITTSTINSQPYPIPFTTGLDGVLLNGNNAGSSNIDMLGNDILGVDDITLNTINGLTPTTIGLVWADFTGTNAYNNLPSTSYQVNNGSSTTSQYADKFEVNAGGLYKNTINVAGMDILDTGSATTTSYTSNNISSTNGTAFTITAGTASSQILNLNCSQLVINSVPYQPPRQVFYQGSSNSFMISSGSFQNVGTLFTLALTANTSYILRYSLTIYNDIYDGTMNMYPQFYNANGNYQSQTWSASRPSNAINNNSAFAGATSQFIVNDWISFTADSNGQLLLDLYYGSSSSINGSYYWSFTGDILSP
tara:strand:- start:890 stop:2413 length:1524 start_codon:yes stop_codon:yes gene_type:complete